MISKETVEHIANLSHLDFSEGELEVFAEQFSKIVGYIDTLNNLDLSELEPLTQIVAEENVFRPDEVRPSLSLDEALRNAPKRNDNFFKVPKVIE